MFLKLRATKPGTCEGGASAWPANNHPSCANDWLKRTKTACMVWASIYMLTLRHKIMSVWVILFSNTLYVSDIRFKGANVTIARMLLSSWNPDAECWNQRNSSLCGVSLRKDHGRYQPRRA